MNQIKRVTAALLTGMLLLSAWPTEIPAFAASSISEDSKTTYETGDTFDDGVLTYTITGSDTVSVTDCELGSQYVNVSSRISGYNVTEIGDGAFEGMENLVSLTLPDSLESIGEGAFNGCTALTKLTIPDSITEIPSGCFQGCTSLKTLTLGDSVTEIGDMAFALCTGLETFTFPDSVSAVGVNLFYDCTALREVTLPSNLTTLGTQMFFSCTALETITIPACVEDVGVMAFAGCTALKEITVEEDNEYYTVQDGILFDKNLEVLYCYPAALEGTSYTVPESTLVIGPSAFMCATSLTSVSLPGSLRYIGEGAFYTCTGLQSITIPESVTTIGQNAFDSCTALHSVTFVGAETEDDSGSELTIEDYAFFACPSLLEVTLPKRVSSIGSYAFGCMEEDDTSSSANAAGDEVAVKAVSGFVLTGYSGTASDYAKNCDVKISFHALDFNWKGLVFWIVLGAVALVVLILAIRLIRRNMMTAKEKEALREAKEARQVPLSQREQKDAQEDQEEKAYHSILGDEAEDEDGEEPKPIPAPQDSIEHGMMHYRGHGSEEEASLGTPEQQEPKASKADSKTE